MYNECFKGILSAAIFCKTPVNNTFIINNSDKKVVEYFIKENSKINLTEFIKENNNEHCIIKYLGQTIIFNYN